MFHVKHLLLPNLPNSSIFKTLTARADNCLQDSDHLLNDMGQSSFNIACESS